MINTVSSFNVQSTNQGELVSLHFRRSWSEENVWVCTANTQDGKETHKRLLSQDYAADVLRRYSNKAEITYFS